MKKYLPILFGLTLFLFGLSTDLLAQVTFGTGNGITKMVDKNFGQNNKLCFS